MDYETALNYLLNREKFGMKLGLKNIKNLLNKLDNPQEKFKTIHVTGTNGKGSTCSFIFEVLKNQGYKVGLYTSPHLVNFRERIRINNDLISKDDIIKYVEIISPLVENETYFEVITALAFLYFKDKKIDFGVIEVGLGGRLDATNVIKPEVSVITKISLEHTLHLGNNIKKIAFEKSGIIKSNVPVVTGSSGETLGVIRRISRKKNSKLYVVNKNYNNYVTSLNGKYQKLNASIALKTLKILQKKGIVISEKSIIDGFFNANWPGRMQFIDDNFLVDCAHNPDGVIALCDSLDDLRIKNKIDEIILITGIMKDKDIEMMCKYFEKSVDEFIITKPKIQRSSDTIEIKKFITKKNIEIDEVSEAVIYGIKRRKELINLGKNILLVIAGSIFLVGEAFEYLQIKPFE